MTPRRAIGRTARPRCACPRGGVHALSRYGFSRRCARNHRRRGQLAAGAGARLRSRRPERLRLVGARPATVMCCLDYPGGLLFAEDPPLVCERLGFSTREACRYSSVAQWQSIRLLTGGLLVRVQPEEPISFNNLRCSESEGASPLCPFLCPLRLISGRRDQPSTFRPLWSVRRCQCARNALPFVQPSMHSSRRYWRQPSEDCHPQASGLPQCDVDRGTGKRLRSPSSLVPRLPSGS